MKFIVIITMTHFYALQVNAEDQQDDVLERSFAKLAQSINPEITKEIERTQEWWLEWNNDTGEHYFDDCL